MGKNIYLIAGANGSGKTTFSKELLKKEKLIFLNADDIALDLCPNDKVFEFLQVKNCLNRWIN